MISTLPQAHYILGSASPRRRELLATILPSFDVKPIDADESYDALIPILDVAEYLAVKKSHAFPSTLSSADILITADTIVAVDKHVLNKPSNKREAADMLRQLSGRKHQVVSGVCIRTSQKAISFSQITDVWFSALSSQEIDHYITTYKPFDKAGGYGIQEWIGYIGIEKLEGDYYSVMGLPVNKLYHQLKSLA